jgi:hypothetical protein
MNVKYEYANYRLSIVLAAIIATISLLVAGVRIAQAQEPTLSIADQLPGRYIGTDLANELKLVIQPGRPVVGLPYAFQLDVTVIGIYNKTNVHILGTVGIIREGDGARVSWVKGHRSIRHFAFEGRCDTHVAPLEDGFEGKTLAGMCITSFQKPIEDAWSLSTTPDFITLKNEKTGEVLNFIKVTKVTKVTK